MYTVHSTKSVGCNVWNKRIILLNSISIIFFFNTSFSKVTSDNLFPVGLYKNLQMKTCAFTSAQEHKLVFNHINNF